MSLAGTVARFARQILKIERRCGYYALGVYRTTEVDSFTIMAGVQPAGEKEINRLPEGTRLDGVINVYTTAKLNITEPPNTVGDRFEWRGKLYEISLVDPWYSHNRYVATRVDP